MALDFSKFGTPVEQTPVLDFSKFGTPAQPPEKQSAFRQIADVPLGIAKGAVQGVRMIADAFGAGSDTSKTIKSAETYLADLMSAQAKNDQQEIARIMKDAEDKGVLDQVKAGIKAFTVAPIDTLSSALGTAAPVIAGALGAKILGAGALVTTGISALTGAGMGAGTIKGSIYEETKNALKEAGASEQDAEARAKLAQEYGGKNLDQILLGTVLGGAAALGPLEKGGAAILARRILGKTGTEATETVATEAAKGAVRRRLEAGALEAVPEAIQAGQEQVAQNIALQREGFDVPTFRGAAGAMTLEALAGAGLGATVGGGKPAVAPEVPPADLPVVPPPAAPEVEAPPTTTEAPPVAEEPPAVEVPVAPESPKLITPEVLTEIGVKPTAAVFNQLKGRSFDDPEVATKLETYANKYATEEVKPKILEFVQTLRAEPVVPTTPEQQRIEEVTGVQRPEAPSAEEAATALERTMRMEDEEGRAFAERATQARLLRQQQEIDAEAERIAELNRKQGMPSPDRPKLEIEERPSIAEAPPELTPREDLLAKQAEVDQRRLEAGLPTGEASATPGVQPTPEVAEEPKPVPKIVDERPLATRAAQNRLLVMRNMLQNQGGDPESLTVVPHPTVEGKFAIQSLDVPTKLTPDLPRTAITRPETPTIIDPVNAYVETQRRTNTPAARAFVSAFEAGKISRDDVSQAMAAERKSAEPPLAILPEGEIISAPQAGKRAEPSTFQVELKQKAEANEPFAVTKFERDGKNVYYASPAETLEASERTELALTKQEQVKADAAQAQLDSATKKEERLVAEKALQDALRKATVRALADVKVSKFVPPTQPEATEEEPPVGEEPPPPKATLPQTLQEFEARMPIVLDKAEVREANNEGNFAKLTKALQLSKNPAIRRIGQLGGGIASKITLRKPGRLGAGVSGVYRYADDSIQMIPSYAGDEHVNAHETLHALISKAQRYPTDRQKPIVADIEKLFAHVKKELKRKGVTAYGLTNVREFTAEAMTNPQFQFELMQLPYAGKKSSWTQFVKLVADLLGIQNTNALTEVMNLVDRLAQTKQPRKTVTDKGLVDESVVEATEAPAIDIDRAWRDFSGRNKLSDFDKKATTDVDGELDEFVLSRSQGKQWVALTVKEQVRDNGVTVYSSALEVGGEGFPSGTGAATTMYLEALNIAKNRGLGWMSESVRSDQSRAIYERLKKAGVPFVEEGGSSYIDAKSLASVDLQKVANKLAARPEKFFAETGTKSIGGERAQVQAREDQQPDNYLYSVEPTVKSDRLPSYKRGVENLRKRWEKGDLTSDEFAARVDILAKQVEMAELAKEKSSRERGADFLRQRLLEAKRRGELSPEAVDFAEWFILQNPALVDDLGISIRTPKEDGVGGMYSSYGRVMYLMKERGSDQTVVHEILHHLERMMPKEVQSAIRKTWIKSLMEAQKNAKTDAEKQFFKNLTDFHFGFGSRSLMKSAIDAIKNGDVSKDLYQYTSPSEFWAENGSEIMRGRFDVKGSVLGRLKQWLFELKEKARSLFGLENKAAIIRALDSLSKGDGKFVSKTLLDEGTEPKLSVTQQGTPGEQAISIVNSLGMGVKPPEPGRAEKAMKMLKDAGENPSLTKESAKKTLTKWLDWFETTVFSSDSAFNNKIRRGIISDFKQNPEVLGMLLEASQSQTVHADALASQFMIDGGLQYNEELKKWESVKKPDNFVALAKKIEELAKKYNVTKDEMERIAHTYFVAKRLPGIIKRNEELDAEIKAERATAKPDRKQIEEWESLKVFVSDEQLAMMEPGLSLVKTIPELKEVVDIWQGIRKNNIDVMVNSGLWSPEYATAMWDNMDYVPYYREEQLEEGAGPQEFIRGLQVKSKEFQLKGSGAAVNDVFDNMIRWSQYAMNRAIRAHKATQMIDAALKIKVDGKPMATKVTEQKRGMNIVRAFRDGKQELYDMADPLFVPAFSSIQNVSIPTLTFMSKVSNVLRQSVVLYPLFSVAQVPQDSFAAMFSSGLKTQHALKIPYLAVKEFIKTLSKTSATHNELTKYGVVGVRDFSATIIRNDAEIYAGLKPPKGGWGKTKEFLEHIAMAADNAVRQAVYEASMQQGLNKSEALEKAFEIINFRRRGTSKMLNVMGQTVPFFYAYLSAQRVAYRVLSGVGISPTERKEALTTLATTSAAVAALSMLYAMAVGDDEDYAETPAAIRDRTLTIPGSGGVRIPLRPDFFLFPKIVAEHTYLMLSDKGFEDAAKFKKSMADAFVSAVASPTPFPTAIKPAIEVAINYDFFQGKPLIGNFEKQKDVERQFRDSTSELAKLFGQTGLISPIAADHMIRGMLGSFGGLLLFGTNQFLHSDPDVPRPELSAKEMLAALPGTSGLLKRPQESALKNDFYVLRDEVEKAANTFSDIKNRSPEGIQAFLEDEKNVARLGLAKGVDKINRELSKIRKVMTQITNMPESQMPADEKAQNIRELRELEREILRSVNVKELREMAKI